MREEELVARRGCVGADFIGISGREALQPQEAFFELNAAESTPVRWTDAVDVERKHPSINGAVIRQLYTYDNCTTYVVRTIIFFISLD